MMKTPIHIPVSEPDLSGNEKKYVDECISSTWISSKGKFINKFEESFAQFLGVKYAVLIEKAFPKTRDQVMHLLEREGIETRPFFIPLTRLPFYRTKEHFPNATYLSHSGLNLPSSVTLKEKQIKRVVTCIKKLQ